MGLRCHAYFTGMVDEVALIRSMYTMHPNHEPALFAIQGGRIIPGRPSLGSWGGLWTWNREPESPGLRCAR